MKNWHNLTFITTFMLLAAPSVSFADDSALVRDLIGDIFQTMQRPPSRPTYDGGPRQFGTGEDAAERLYSRQEIQKRLSMLGYNAGYPDGRFGSQTRVAIAAFQSGLGHKTTGKITENEIAILYDKTNGSAVGSTAQKNGNVVQPVAAPKSAEKLQEVAPTSLAPDVTLKPSTLFLW